MDLVFHGLDGGQESGDKNHAITEDGEESWEGTKGRYCNDHLRKFRCCSWIIVNVVNVWASVAWKIELCFKFLDFINTIKKRLANDLIPFVLYDLIFYVFIW